MDIAKSSLFAGTHRARALSVNAGLSLHQIEDHGVRTTDSVRSHPNKSFVPIRPVSLTKAASAYQLRTIVKPTILPLKQSAETHAEKQSYVARDEVFGVTKAERLTNDIATASSQRSIIDEEGGGETKLQPYTDRLGTVGGPPTGASTQHMRSASAPDVTAAAQWTARHAINHSFSVGDLQLRVKDDQFFDALTEGALFPAQSDIDTDQVSSAPLKRDEFRSTLQSPVGPIKEQDRRRYEPYLHTDESMNTSHTLRNRGDVSVSERLQHRTRPRFTATTDIGLDSSDAPESGDHSSASVSEPVPPPPRTVTVRLTVRPARQPAQNGTYTALPTAAPHSQSQLPGSVEDGPRLESGDRRLSGGCAEETADVAPPQLPPLQEQQQHQQTVGGFLQRMRSFFF